MFSTGSIYGIDLSMVSTGVARIRTDLIVTTNTIGSVGKRADELSTRSRRITNLADEIVRPVISDEAVLVVIESPSYGSTGASSWDRAGLWWLVVTKLNAHNIAVALCAPATRAKYATGSGQADKAAVAAAASKLFPDTEIGNSDEADALILAHIGASYLHWDVGTLVRHRDAMQAVRFPSLISD